MFLHHNIHHYSLTSTDEKIHIQIDDVLFRLRQSNGLDIRPFGAADCELTAISWWQKLGRD
jgi:hypothetical protein